MQKTAAGDHIELASLSFSRSPQSDGNGWSIGDVINASGPNAPPPALQTIFSKAPPTESMPAFARCSARPRSPVQLWVKRSIGSGLRRKAGGRVPNLKKAEITGSVVVALKGANGVLCMMENAGDEHAGLVDPVIDHVRAAEVATSARQRRAHVASDLRIVGDPVECVQQRICAERSLIATKALTGEHDNVVKLRRRTLRQAIFSHQERPAAPVRPQSRPRPTAR